MQRTQIYLTDEQQAKVADLAASRSVSKAEVIRDLLDRGLGTGDRGAEARAAIRSTAGICQDYPDWPEWLAEVRADGGTRRRLENLGL